MAFRLCIFCRALEPADTPCPNLPSPQSSRKSDLPDLPGPSPSDSSLLASLQSEASTLCRRCEAYDLPGTFTSSPRDPSETNGLPNPEWEAHAAQQERHKLRLGRLSELHLDPTCPLCRLLYAVFPRDPDPGDELLAVVPFRSYVQEAGWDTFPAEEKARCAVFLGVERVSLDGFTSGSRIGDHAVRTGIKGGAAIALSRGQEAGRANKARVVGGGIDLSGLRAQMEMCGNTHGDACRSHATPELLSTRMVDVVARRVVACPPGCVYAALSYVWGGVRAEDGALESGTLPQTIEDAITVARGLGLRYLWVDALCIDQTRNPTPEQLTAKNEQLRIMDRIYAGASLTLAAVAGTTSASGIPGVSAPRPQQMEEAIDGVGTLFTVPPHWSLAAEGSVWYGRAWTLQEAVMSRRSVYFCGDQWHFACPAGGISESTDPGSVVRRAPHPAVGFLRMLMGDSHGEGTVPTHGGRFEAFASLLESYTERRMTHASDSLNAMLGILSAFERGLFAKGFIHGLPLASHPYSLGWMHVHSVVPKRRDEFPSWSWAGWEGTVRFPQRLLLEQPEGGAYPRSDLEPAVLAHEGASLTLSAWLVDLEVVTEPFSEVRIPNSTETTGFVTERNFPHPTTLPSGVYSCLVAQRISYGGSGGRQVVVMVVLGWEGDVAARRTLITLDVRMDLLAFGAQRRVVALV